MRDRSPSPRTARPPGRATSSWPVRRGFGRDRSRWWWCEHHARRAQHELGGTNALHLDFDRARKAVVEHDQGARWRLDVKLDAHAAVARFAPDARDMRLHHAVRGPGKTVQAHTRALAGLN